MAREFVAQMLLGLPRLPHQLQGREKLEMAALAGGETGGRMDSFQDDKGSLRHAANSLPWPKDSQVNFR